ncbi:hypothetical protein [Streptomyces aurantiogriseus]|nr:hypothetical protein [Streptomyces aurantiogriseus]
MTTADVADAVDRLLRNRSVNAVQLSVDRGTHAGMMKHTEERGAV